MGQLNCGAIVVSTYRVGRYVDATSSGVESENFGACGLFSRHYSIKISSLAFNFKLVHIHVHQVSM